MLRYELLNPDEILDSKEFAVVESFLAATGRTEIGWHYVVDLTWIYRQVQSWPADISVIDLGGGSGPTQFLLAELGFRLSNIDLALREPPRTLEKRYSTRLVELASFVPTDYLEHLGKPRFEALRKFARKTRIYDYLRYGSYEQQHDDWRRHAGLEPAEIGTLSWVRGNLAAMPEIESDSFDAVVSLSALEHVPREDLPSVVAETKRVLKPHARWAITTSATEQDATWFHEPSKGFAFSETDLQTLFSASPDRQQDAAKILEMYKSCKYLKNNLAAFYKRSGDNGMPWGKWEPQYIPVGLSR